MNLKRFIALALCAMGISVFAAPEGTPIKGLGVDAYAEGDDWYIGTRADGKIAAFCDVNGTFTEEWIDSSKLALDVSGPGTLSFDCYVSKDPSYWLSIEMLMSSDSCSDFFNTMPGEWKHCEFRTGITSSISLNLQFYDDFDVTVQFGIANLKWTPAPEKIAVKFVTGCDDVVCGPGEYEPGMRGSELPVPERTGYEFRGWYRESTFETRIGEYDLIPFEPQLTLYAKWVLPLSLLDHDGMAFSEVLYEGVPAWLADIMPGTENQLAAFHDVNGGSYTELQLSGLSGRGTLSFDLWSDGYVGLLMRYGTQGEDYGETMCTVESWKGGLQHFEVPVNMTGDFLVRWEQRGWGEGLTRVCVANVAWTPAPEKIRVICDVPGGDPIAVGEFAPGVTFGELPPPERAGYEFVGWIDSSDPGLNPLTGEPLIRLFGKTELLPFAEEVHVQAYWGLPLAEFKSGDLGYTDLGDFPWFVADGEKGESGEPVARALVCGSTGGAGVCGFEEERNVAKLGTTVTGFGTLTFKYRTAPSWDGTQRFTCKVDGVQEWEDSLGQMAFFIEDLPEWNLGAVTVLGEGEHAIRWDYFNSAEDAAIVDICDVVWTPAPAEITVSFDSDGGTACADATYRPGEAFGELPVPTREGWDFCGWYMQLSNPSLPAGAEEMVPFENLTLTAKWSCPISNMKDANLTFTTSDEAPFRLTNVKTPKGGAAAEAYPDSEDVSYVLETTIPAAGYLSFNYLADLVYTQRDFGYLPVYSFRVLIDGKAVLDESWLDPGEWKTGHFIVSGKKKHKVRFEVIGARGAAFLLGDIAFGSAGAQESLEAWTDKLVNYSTWITGDLPRFAKEYAARFEANPDDYEARVLHAVSILANLAENKDFQKYAKTFGYTIDYAHCAFKGTLKLDSKTAQVNTMADTAIKVAMPVMQEAIADLDAIPSDWAGTVKISSEDWPIDEDVYLDRADVLFAKASLQGGIGLLQLLGGYDLTVDWPKAKAEMDYDPTRPIASVASLPDVSGDAEWLRVAPIAGDGEVIREMRLVKCGERLAVRLEASEGRSFADSIGVTFNLTSSKGSLSLSVNLFSDEPAEWSFLMFGQIGDRPVFGEVSGAGDASRDGFLLLTFDLQGQNVGLASTAWKFSTGEFSIFGDDDEIIDADWEYSPVPARVQKAIQEQTKFFSKVRNLTRVTNAKDWVRNALETALLADGVAMNRTDGLLHFVEYDDVDAKRVDVARKNTKKALESLDSENVKFDLAELSATEKIAEDYDFTLLPGGGDMIVYLGALFTGEITRDYLPFTYLNEYGLLCIDFYSMKDPTFAGLLPEMTCDDWAEFLKQPKDADVHPVQETPFVPGEKVSLSCPRLIGYKAAKLPKGWKWDAAKGLLTGTASSGFTVKFTSGSHEKTVEFKVDPLPQLSVVLDQETIAEYGEGVIVVGGAGGFKANATAKARAEVAAGFAFVGWFDEKGELVSKDKIYSFKMPVVDVTLTAKAIALADDGLTFEEIRSEIVLAKGEPVDTGAGAYFRIASGSAYTVSASGLPSGVSLDKLATSSYVLSGAPKKAGVFYATLTAKNNGGFAMSRVIRFVVGGATETFANTANIDLSGFVSEELSTGYGFYFDTEVPCHVSGSRAKSVKVKGLPSGLEYAFSPSKEDNAPGQLEISGCARKSGVCTVTVTVTYANKKTAKAVTKIIVRDSGCVYIPAAVAPACAGLGTVSGGGVKAYGSTVTLTTKPKDKKKHVFAGWYEDADLSKTVKDWSSAEEWRMPTFSFVVVHDEPFLQGCEIYGRFIAKGDDLITFTGPLYKLQVPGPSASCPVDVRSASLPTVTASGVPSGFKFSGMKLSVTDYSKVKPGVHMVKLTAKNASGHQSAAAIEVRVANLNNAPHLYGLNTNNGMDGEKDNGEPFEGYTFDSRVAYDCDLEGLLGISVDEGWTLKVTGLPKGLSVKNGKLTGVATVTGPVTVTFTLTKRGEPTEMATATFNMAPLPNHVVGTFAGSVSRVTLTPTGEIEKSEPGVLALTVATSGKVSGNYNIRGSKVTFSGKLAQGGVSDGNYMAELSAKVGGKPKTFIFSVSGGQEPGDEKITFSGDLSETQYIQLIRIAECTLPKCAREITVAGEYTVVDNGQEQRGTLSLKFAKNGSVKSVWKVGGKSASATVSALAVSTSDGKVLKYTMLLGIPPSSTAKTVGVYGYVDCWLTLNRDALVEQVEMGEEIIPFGNSDEEE